MSLNVPTYAFLWPMRRNKMNLGAASPPGPFFGHRRRRRLLTAPNLSLLLAPSFSSRTRERERERDSCCTVPTPSLIIHAPLNGRKKRRQTERATKLSLFSPSLVGKGPFGAEKRAFYCVWFPSPLHTFRQFTSSQSFGAWFKVHSVLPRSNFQQEVVA